MTYEFSLGSFFFGIIILIVAVLVMRFYAWVADNFAGGVSSYDHVKLFALIGCVIGLIVMFNLHTLILGAIFSAIFPSLGNN
jgi:hypothetical protein